jgi:ubiquitin-conjugating enzyme E2 D
MLQKRLQKELQQIDNEKIPGITILPIKESLTSWKAIIIGPVGTPYDGGKFNLMIDIPAKYPFEPPKITFETMIFHPNISNKGKICLSILRDQWAACLTIEKALLSIISLMASPNPDDPLMPEVAKVYLNNRDKFNEIATNFTKKYAT